MSQRVADLVRHAGVTLRAAGIEDAQREARSLVALALGVAPDRVSLLAHDEVTPDAIAQLQDLLERRATQRVPMSHLTGWRDFYRHRFEVSGDVLDPRPDTETLVEAALSHPFGHVLDLGTGSGCILLSLLAERVEAAGIGTDISPAALTLADRNARRLGVADRCLLLQSDWFEAVEGRFDLVVSNPPYIAADEMQDLGPELMHEPRGALTDEADGLSAYRRIVPGAVSHLRPGGRLLVEIGWTQAAEVSRLFSEAGFVRVAVLRDIEGRDRVIAGEIPL
ncbi:MULTISPECIES: peptide chain release factor N(5)-glutamine methyltransferase [unclassified Roseovarius]|uniref:peptide chain release factor N(5)-glutamine methyltransferase n=1 Tax=unclassified Roseovarius TaxID=2614913 RepID=UPI00273E78AD|nr:peptide chain release factor N(5)-glutamine methyltransferase [Roseovarius sp. MMSF_3350]